MDTKIFNLVVTVEVTDDSWTTYATKQVRIPTGENLSGLLAFGVAVREIAFSLVSVVYREAVAALAKKVKEEKAKKEAAQEA